MLVFRIGNQKEAPRPWYLEYKTPAGAWMELPNSRTRAKNEVASFLNVAQAVATVVVNEPQRQPLPS